ncbi:MAG TPA: DNA adenine methylase [Usitatibacter sp.]|nr:DNA adenine methylase [Usitatibacter sp.]
MTLKAPFPYFGGKRHVVDEVWSRLGSPKQYIEPFCGSCAMLFGAREPASLEVVNDANGFLANFWRAVKHQPGEVARAADYPVSHVDLGARHRWLMEQRDRLGAEMQDPHWPGDATVAGWWLWGQCSWIGSGWCDWFKADDTGKVPHVGNAGRGIQATGQVPHVSNAGRGIQATGKVPHVSDAGMGDLLTTGGMAAWVWLHKLAARLERVRIVHGEWSRCLNNHYGANDTAVFLDPPYKAFESLYGAGHVATDVEAWARENAHLRVALCGHAGDYDLPGWELMPWSRPHATYSGTGTKGAEAIWFSPACLRPGKRGQLDLLGGAA